jgi:hypothetical protein
VCFDDFLGALQLQRPSVPREELERFCGFQQTAMPLSVALDPTG